DFRAHLRGGQKIPHVIRGNVQRFQLQGNALPLRHPGISSRSRTRQSQNSTAANPSSLAAEKRSLQGSSVYSVSIHAHFASPIQNPPLPPARYPHFPRRPNFPPPGRNCISIICL